MYNHFLLQSRHNGNVLHNGTACMMCIHIPYSYEQDIHGRNKKTAYKINFSSRLKKCEYLTNCRLSFN